MKSERPGGGALLHVSHVTRLGYAESVVEARSEVRQTPLETPQQRLVTHKLEISPIAPVRSHVDYFGNRVHVWSLLEPHDGLVITAESVVETRADAAHEPDAPTDARPWPQRLAEYLQWSPAVPELEAYAEIDHRVRTGLEPADFLAALREVAATFGKRFRYAPGATDVHSSPAVLFEFGGGVCQDLAHALIGVLRRGGVPARYVSGYLYAPIVSDAGARASASSHAWVEAWHPSLGWVGIDPTCERLVDWQYVHVARGRDYSDVQPHRGFYVGSDEQTLHVEVAVARIG